MNRRLLPSGAFLRALRRYRKSHPGMSPKIFQTLERLEADAFQPSLGTHKLKGGLAGLFACSVAFDLRIVFSIESSGSEEEIVLVSLGSHDEVY
jgi:mRNA-degrading endonuclease YafQ of YafQ-DinJ toxin-antitoxin module